MLNALKTLWTGREMPHRAVMRQAAIAEGLDEVAQGANEASRVAALDASLAKCEREIASCIEQMQTGISDVSSRVVGVEPRLRLEAAWRVRSAARRLENLTCWQLDLIACRRQAMGLGDPGRVQYRGSGRMQPPLQMPSWYDYDWE